MVKTVNKKEKLENFFDAIKDQRSPVQFTLLSRLICELLVADERTINTMFDFYQLHLELTKKPRKAKKTSLSEAASILSAQGASKGGKVLSEAKIASNKVNAQKAGRPYEYVIFGYQAGEKSVLGKVTDRTKAQAQAQAESFLPGYEHLELVYIAKVSPEERKAASDGIVISPSSVII